MQTTTTTNDDIHAVVGSNTTDDDRSAHNGVSFYSVIRKRHRPEAFDESADFMTVN
jgi:hypothetical protein